MKFFSFFTKTAKGFTLVELLVVLGLFSGIATLSLGALFNAQVINSRLQETQAILDNVNLSIQSITRDIRFGTDFYCATYLPTIIPTIRRNCTNADSVGGNVIILKSSDAVNDNDRVAYYVSNGILYKNEYAGGSTSTLQMTSNEVFIEDLSFYVEGAQSSDGTNDYNNDTDLNQPLITILISGRTRSPHQSVAPVSFSIETNVSAHELDNK